MRDVRCGWCGTPLPDQGGAQRRYCRPAHRQAAWRARRRSEGAATARQAMVLADAELLARARTVLHQADDLPAGQAAMGGNSAAVAEVFRLAGQLVERAVLADRRAGASWARIGAALGITGTTARRRFGRVEAAPEDARAAPEDATAGGTGCELLEPLLLRAVREADASAGGLFLLSPDRGELRPAVTTGGRAAGIWERVAPAGAGPVADAVRERRPVWVGSHTELARRYPRIALAFPYPAAVAAAPVTADTVTWGALALLWPGSHPPELSAHQREVISAVCERTGALLRQAAGDGRPILPGERPHVPGPQGAQVPRLPEALAAVDLVDRLAEGCVGLDLEGRITFVSAAARDLLGGGTADLLGTPLWEALAWLDEPVFQDHHRAAVISRRPAFFTARRPPDQWLDFQLHPDDSGVSVRITPAERTGPADRPRPGSGAGTAGPTRARALYDLLHLAASLTQAVSVRDVVELSADEIMPAFDAQGFVLAVTEGGRLCIVGSRGYRPEVLRPLDGPPLTDRSAPTVYALAEAAPLFFSTPREMERFHPDIPRLTKRSAWAFLPLIVSGRPVGCWTLTFDRPRPFTCDERAVLTSLAGLIAQALDRARLYDAKHQLAHNLQTGLLPQALPAVPGLEIAARYLPAAHGMDVGGDFYDLIRLGGTGVAAAIGDVQGHNMTAAAVMGQVRTAVHATAGAPPGEVLARTNRLLTDFDAGLFASCLYVHVDLAHHRARLASAGHPPALLRRPDGHTEVVSPPPGLLLGIDPAADYQGEEIALPPGTVLALYTDGLVESPGVDPDDATAALADHLARAGDQPLDAVADHLMDHTSRAVPRSDDIALLLLHPRPPRASRRAGD
ncbi:SpoIIE family protein phosphatase [Streptomyces sp. NPDC004542]|uniref:SpoIIE family protein phosphatase n=1 Tax=Streptomyces sp. NPDC004542 TaxID=3154281 RepID=UPI0033AE2F53